VDGNPGYSCGDDALESTIAPTGAHRGHVFLELGYRCVCNDAGVTTSGQVPVEGTQFQVSWNRHSFRRKVLPAVVLFLAYAALAVFTSGTWQLIGVVFTIAFGLIGLCLGIAIELRIRRSPMAATLSDFGVTIRRRDPVGWEDIGEVRPGTVKPRSLFMSRRLPYIAFLPTRAADVSRLSPRERLATKLYGTHLVLLTEMVNPAAEDILDAIERLSNVPVYRVVDE
jgi:hypothetical protein